MAWTKEYRKEYMEKYREENAERLKANHKYYYKRNKDKCLAYAKAYHQQHKNDPEYKAKRAALQRKWYANNRDKWNGYLKERRA